MSVELQTDEGVALVVGTWAPVADDHPSDRRHPNVSGDLPTVLDSAPMFRRAVLGYDRFQVDTYVRWAEDELTTADRERRHLEARHLATRAALDEAELLLSHSSSGGEFLQVSRRIGALLASAADEAESMRAAAQADRSAASVRAQRLAEHAERLLAAAEAEAGRTVLAAATRADALEDRARRAVAEAEQVLTDAGAEAAARLETVRVTEQRAAEQAAQVRREAVADASAALLRARHEVVALLAAGREERRRADAGALATRERLDDEALARRTFLLAEVDSLEQRRSALQAEIERLATASAARTRPRLDIRLRQLPQTFRWRSRSLRAR